MVERDPRLDPWNGDVVRHPKRGTLRKVTKVDTWIIYYTSQSGAGRNRDESVRLEDWQKWCKTHRVEVVAVGT